MAAGNMHSASSRDHHRTMSDHVPLHQNYGWAGSASFPETSHALGVLNGSWDAGMSALSSFDNPSTFDDTLSGAVWPSDGNPLAEDTWDAHSLPNFDSHGQLWPMSPWDGTLSNSHWSPADQPLPSPLSEVAPYDFSPSQVADDAAYLGQTSPGTDPILMSPTTRLSIPNSPATTTSSVISTPISASKDKGKQRATARGPSSKRPTEKTPPNARPRTLKRHRSDPPPQLASSASTPSSLVAAAAASTKTRIGGVLPVNVDPRVAAERIRRDAWERCRVEAHAMAQRREMLRDHEQGALEREARRLQASLERMRESAARGR